MKDRIEVIIIPTGNALAVLPAAMVRQILPYAPVISDEEGADCTCGTLIIHQEKLNVIDMARWIDHPAAVSEGGEKLIWSASLQTSSSLSGYVYKASSMPFFMLCKKMDIEEVGTSDHPLVAHYVTVSGLDNPDNLPVFIPDLINLEIELTS